VATTPLVFIQNILIENLATQTSMAN